MLSKAILLLCSALPAWCAAQTIRIVDALTLEPVAGVMATMPGSELYSVSSASGTLDLCSFPIGGTVQLEHLGYAKVVVLAADLLGVQGPYHLLPRNYDLEEFVVSANRFTERASDVAEPIAVIKTRDIHFLDQPSTGDVLQNSGTLFLQKSQAGGGSPVVRGFEASRVLLVVDGVRMNNAIYRSGHLQDIMTVDANSLERIEVISGPASVAYGSDALGGVVHMMTRQVEFRDSAGLSVGGGAFMRYASANTERTMHADLSLAAKRLSSFTSITASDFGDLRQGRVRDGRYPGFGLRLFNVERRDNVDVVVPNPDPDVQLGTAYRQLDVIEKLRLRSGARTVHQLNLQLSTSSDLPRYDRLSEYTLDSIGAIVPMQAEWYYGPQQRIFAAYTLELANRSFFDEAKITPSFQHVEQSRHTRGFGGSRLASRWEQVDVVAINADFEKRSGKHEVRYGVEAFHNTVGSRAQRRNRDTGELTYLTTRYPNGGSTFTGLAAYATHTIEVNERWVLSDGLRYNHVALNAIFADDIDFQFLNGEVQQRNGAFNWRVGAVYRPTKYWRVTALVNTGFRAANVDDLGKVFDSSPGKVTVPNPGLRPERTLNAEFGLSRNFGERTTWQLNAFHTWYTDAFVVRNFTSNGRDSIDYDGTMSQVTALTNVGRAIIIGGSSSISSNVSERIVLNASVTYTHGRVRSDTTDRPLDHIPPVFGRCSIGYRMERVQAEAYLLFNGWKRIADYSTSGEDNPQYATPDGMPGWYTLNVRSSITLHRHLALQVGVENILDRNYRTFASGVSAPGRNLQVSIRTTF